MHGVSEFRRRKALERLANKLKEDPNDFSALRKLEQATALLSGLSFKVNLWEVQNICFGMLDNVYRQYQAKAEQGDEQAEEWLQAFRNIAKSLAVRV